MSKKKSATKAAAAPKETRAAKSAKVAPAKKAPAAKSAAEEATEKLTEKQPKKLSAIDAAAQVLAKAKEPMTTKALVETMAAEGLWSSPGGKTPAQTLYSAILREINVKGEESRFAKSERGKFAANA